MDPTMLVSGGDTPLGNSIIQQALAEGFNVVATAPNMSRKKAKESATEQTAREESETLMLAPWGRLSPVSSRNVVLRAAASYGAIDQAIVVHNLTNERRVLHELPLVMIQEITDVQLKSHLFLVKEIISHFLQNGRGVLSMVVDTGGHEELTTIDSLVTAGFIALTKSLMATYRNEPIVINAFDSRSSDGDDYASYILSVVSSLDSGSRWYHHGEKSRLFGGVRRSRARR